MSVSKINYNDNQEIYIIVDPISEINKDDFRKYLDFDSPYFLKCEFDNEKVFSLYYKYEKRISLKQFLSQVVSADEAIDFLKSLTKAYMVAQEAGMNTNHILLSINSIFYDIDSRQVSCIYIPTIEGVLPTRPLRLFIKEILVNMVYGEADDMAWLGNTIRYINSNRSLDYNDFVQFLETQKSAEETADEEMANEEPNAAEDSLEAPSEDIVIEEDLPEEDEPVLESIPVAESVDALKAEPKEADEPVDSEEVIVVEDLSDQTPDEETAEVGEDEVVMASIVRRSNHQAFDICSGENHIGKSSANEICIDDNAAISRVHAVITSKDGKFSIRDNGSTNHTFVNGVLLQGDAERNLSGGDRILLGNEELIFKI